MNELVYRGTNDQAMTNSLLVAEKFGKEHKHVLDAVRNIIMTAENSAVLSMFCESTYVSSQNKELPMFIMTRDGFSLLVMGFNGKDALNFKLDFMNAFNKMESMLKSDDYILARSQEILNQRLQLASQKVQMLEDTVQHQELEIKQLAPRAEYTDKVLQSTATYTLTQIAHDLNMRSVHEFTHWCKSKGVLYHQSGQWQPTAKVAGKGYFTTRTARYFKSDGTPASSLSTVVTELGRSWLHSIMQNDKVAV